MTDQPEDIMPDRPEDIMPGIRGYLDGVYLARETVEAMAPGTLGRVTVTFAEDGYTVTYKNPEDFRADLLTMSGDEDANAAFLTVVIASDGRGLTE